MLNRTLNFNFVSIAKPALMASIALVVLSLALIVVKGFNFGLDFTGGTVIEVKLVEDTSQAKISEVLEKAGYGEATVQNFGTPRDFAIRLQSGEGEKASVEVSRNVLAALGEGLQQEVKLTKTDFVGPQVGAELGEKGIIAMVMVMLGTLAYVSFRFQWRFAVASILMQFHDVMLTTGLIVLLGVEVDLNVLAALLAVIGYSINDKIVVYDRMRELFRSARKHEPMEVVNLAINQTLARTIVTSGSTLLTVVVLFVFGGRAVEGLSFTLMVGIIIGLFSSNFVAGPTVVALGVTKKDLLVVAKDSPELARRP